MAEIDHRTAMFAVVSVATQNLNDDQLITLNLIGALGTDPRNTIAWPAAKALFTTETADGIPVMHEETKHGVKAEIRRREI